MKKIVDDCENLYKSIFVVIVFHMLLCLGIQLQNLVTIHSDFLTILYKVFFYQFESLTISLLLCVPMLWIYQWKKIRLLYFYFLLIFFVYLSLNQIYYSIFFDHFQFGLFEGQEVDFKNLKDSLLFEISWLSYVNLLISIFMSRFIYRFISLKQIPLWTSFIAKKSSKLSVMVFVLIYLTSIITWFYKPTKDNIFYHPVVSLVKNLIVPDQSFTLKANPNLDIQSLKFANSNKFNHEKEAAWLANYHSTNKNKKRNVYLFITESVGSLQIMPQGQFDATLTPNLSKLQMKMVVAKNLYNSYPGTTRSHLPLMTGGSTVTWGSIFTDLGSLYQGANLPLAFANAGYKTAVFSAAYMTTDNLRGVYQSIPFSYEEFPDQINAELRQKIEVNSWGIDERYILSNVQKWKKTQGKDIPQFVSILTSTTHHPYGLPKDVKAKFPGDDRLNRYRSSIYFLDSVIGEFYENVILKENAILVVVGDHGQAFGEIHKNNFTHKNHLYEENIKNYLMFIDPQINEPIEIDYSGKIGDVFPTIAHLLQFSLPETLGKSLFDTYTESLSFFHKDTRPEKWGLKDGNWKFVTEKFTNKNPELYDLQVDPLEKNNLAYVNPDKVKLYHQLTAEWYVRTNNEFLKKMSGENSQVGKNVSIEDLSNGSIASIEFGSLTDDRKFLTHETLSLSFKIGAKIKAFPFQNDRRLMIEWLSPSGKSKKIPMVYKARWSHALLPLPDELKLEAGEWKIIISDGLNKPYVKAFHIKE